MSKGKTYTCSDCDFGTESYSEWKDHRDVGCKTHIVEGQ